MREERRKWENERERDNIHRTTERKHGEKPNTINCLLAHFYVLVTKYNRLDL